MPIYINWLVPNRITYFRYRGDITVDEVRQASDVGLELLGYSEGQLIHTLQDNKQMTRFPHDLRALSGSVRTSLEHPYMGWMLSYGVEDKLTRFVATTISQITRTRYRIVDDLPAALRFLNYVDSTLPDLTGTIPPPDEEALYVIETTPDNAT